MQYVEVSGEGQITLPADVREALSISPHSKLSLSVEQGQIVLRQARDWRELKGILKGAVPHMSEEDAIAEGAAERCGIFRP